MAHRSWMNLNLTHFIMHHFRIAILFALLTLIFVACGDADEAGDESLLVEPSDLTPKATAEPVELIIEPPITSTPLPTESIIEPTATPTVVPTASPPPTATATATPAPKATPTASPASRPERDLDIRTILPPDAIPAIDDPRFFETVEEADAVYPDGELVLGVEIDGDARAYSVPLLSSHEIVNDVVGGHPIAITW